VRTIQSDRTIDVVVDRQGYPVRIEDSSGLLMKRG
jgi:hypothetical protein